MRVAIIGLGGVGGYIAAAFYKAGIDVTGFARGQHLHAIEQKGLQIVEDDISYNVLLPVQSTQDATQNFDVVFFCVKSYDLQASYHAIAPHITPQTLLVPLCNGVDNGEKLRMLGASPVVDATVHILSHIQEPGIIRKKGSLFAVLLGAQDPQQSASVAALFAKANLRYKIPENIQEALWKKYLFIATFATLTAYYDKPIAAIYKEHFEETQKLLAEIACVAQHHGIDLKDEIQKVMQNAAKVPKDASTSMHLDFQNRRKTELETLSGYIAKSNACSTPLMQKYYQELQKRA